MLTLWTGKVFIPFLYTCAVEQICLRNRRVNILYKIPKVVTFILSLWSSSKKNKCGKVGDFVNFEYTAKEKLFLYFLSELFNAKDFNIEQLFVSKLLLGLWNWDFLSTFYQVAALKRLESFQVNSFSKLHGWNYQNLW